MIEAEKSKYGEYRTEIFVDTSLIGFVIGKGGSAIKDVQDKYYVQINIAKDSPKEQPNKKGITIIGKRKEDVEHAKDEIYIEKVTIPIDENLIDFVCGAKD
jgi:predicted PilT family ATPase